MSKIKLDDEATTVLAYFNQRFPRVMKNYRCPVCDGAKLVGTPICGPCMHTSIEIAQANGLENGWAVIGDRVEAREHQLKTLN